MPATPLRVLATPEAIGDDLAPRLLERIEHARARGAHFLLGCPTGRTPEPIYDAIARRLEESRQDISHVILVMMDEYLIEVGDELAWAPIEAPGSCHRFAHVEMLERFNARLPARWRMHEESVWFPDPRDPAAYDRRIADAGGIDFFLLASGASDGHVAFNGPGAPRDSRTRIVVLSDETRRDNLHTFPSFGSLTAVPTHGVCVGIDTIASAREAVMVVWGARKAKTLARMLRADHYESEWPATVIHECAAREIICDVDAATPE